MSTNVREKEVSICCLQETHLQPSKTFKIRGYQCFRADREGKHKGRIITLVRNNINAVETVRHMEGAEYLGVKMQTNNMELHVLNYCCPNEKSLALDSFTVPQSEFLIVGDFNSH